MSIPTFGGVCCTPHVAPLIRTTCTTESLGGHQDEAAARTCHSNGFDDPGRDDRPSRPCTSPDLRSELPRLPADLPGHRGLLLRVPLSNDGAVCRVGLGPLRAMRGQSILRRAECRARQAPKAASAVLKTVRLEAWHSADRALVLHQP